VETGVDLDASATQGVRIGPRVLWVGSGGLASALASRLSRSPGAPRPDAVPVSGPILTVVGSRSEIAAVQVAHLRSAGARLCGFPPQALDGTDTALAARCVSEVLAHLEQGEDVVVAITGPSVRMGSGRDEALAAALGVRLRPVADLVAGLVLTGGDTASGLLRAWGIDGLQLVGQVEPGIPLSVALAARRLPVVTKAGAFGTPASLTVARDRLRREP
jgi:4-hydroxythreonine-4-phosphate dehydrogenase